MDRRAAVVAIFCAATAWGAPSKAPSSSRRVELHLKSIDAEHRAANVEVTGASRAPAANLFTFTDVRERHFVAMTARCDDPVAERRACRLEIPAGYEKHPLASLVLHLHGLHGRVVEVPKSEIDAANAALENAAPQKNDAALQKNDEAAKGVDGGAR